MTIPMPVAYGVEAHCFEDFRSWVIEQYKAPPLVAIREETRYSIKARDEAVRHYQDYFVDDLEILSQCPNVNKLQAYPYVNWKNMSNKTIQFHGRCEKGIRQSIPKLATIFCNATYGSIKQALTETNHLYELWNSFEEWFEKWRKRFMARVDKEIAEVLSKQQVQIGAKRKAAPVGAVANLCKVLTKTMEQQGADIRSIAKVQYAICTQNGIYIPDEFLRDVAVALEIEERL